MREPLYYKVVRAILIIAAVYIVWILLSSGAIFLFDPNGKYGW